MTAEELIARTKELMLMRTTADNPVALKDAIEYVRKLVEKVPDVTIERFERNGKPSLLAYRGKQRPEKFDLLLNGHVDVVPAKDAQFKPYEKDGKLYGRGALDMKGTTLALTDVFCELVNEVPYQLGLQIVSDEEIGGYDGVALQLEQGVRANFVIMGEYSNQPNTIYNAARGLCWAEIEFSGKSAHGGHLWHGTNAVVKAGDFAGAVLKRYPTPDKETWTTTASIASLSTPNTTYNKVPDKAILKIDFRFTQEDPVFRSKESIVDFIHSIDPDAKLINLAVYEPAVNVETLNPYVQGLSAAIKKVNGAKPRFLGRPGASDGRHYALIDNDIIEFGLYGGGSHSAKEYVYLKSFGEYQAILREFLLEPVPAKLSKATDLPPLHEQLLARLVEMPTVSGDFGAVNTGMMFIAHFLETRGMHVEQFEINGYKSLVATTKAGNKQPTVLFNAHLDVVPAPEEMFKLKLKGGKFYGRGVLDNKHAIAACLALADSLKDELDAYDFGIMISSDEEIGSNNTVKPLLEMGYRPKVTVIPDCGNNWKLETFAKGVYWIEFEASGKTGHSSRPWEGDDAIRRLLGALREVEGLVPSDPKPEDTILTVGTIKGGTTANQIPAAASAVVDIRTGSVADHERLAKEIPAVAKKHGVKATFISYEPPCVSDPENPFIKPMVEIVEQVTGSSHDTSKSYAVSEARLFVPYGIPTIVINPEGGGIHTDAEWLSRASFTQFCQVLETYVRRMATQKPATLSNNQQEIASLAKRLNYTNKGAYVWYATYGTGLSKENFVQQIDGGRHEGSSRTFPGCSDKTPPLRDAFLSLPYAMYFAGHSPAWGGSSYINIQPEPIHSAHTIARAYLITTEQFEEIVAHHNDRAVGQALPLKEAMLHGHATVGDGSGHYDELVFCGIKDGLPIFTVTAVKPELPYTPPTPLYTRMVCRGLSEDTDFDRRTAIEYMLAAPGIAGHYKEQDLAKFFKEFTP
jgi:succinyl-diaminopimelate desuccinylase